MLWTAACFGFTLCFAAALLTCPAKAAETQKEDAESTCMLQAVGARAPAVQGVADKKAPRFFCKHDSRTDRYYDDCSACVVDPICCDTAKAQSSGGHLWCNQSSSSYRDISDCDGADRPAACTRNGGKCTSVMACNEDCKTKKAYFKTSITEETGRYFAYWYSTDYGADLDTPQPSVEMMLVTLHGAGGNGYTYLCRSQNAALAHYGENPKHVGVMSLQFNTCYDQNRSNCNRGYDDPSDISKELYWKEQMAIGEDSTSNLTRQLSSYAVLDEILAYLASSPNLPKLKVIKVFGYSKGARYMHRYSIFGNYSSALAKAGVDIEFFVGGPTDFLYFDRRRPVLSHPKSCGSSASRFCDREVIDSANYTFETKDYGDCRYNHWPYGLEGDMPPYMQKVNISAALAAYRHRKVNYVMGSLELCDLFQLVETPCLPICREIGLTPMPAPEKTPKYQVGDSKAEAFSRDWKNNIPAQAFPKGTPEWAAYDFCASERQGLCVYMRSKIFGQYLDLYYGGNHSLRSIVVPTTHDGCATWQSPIVRQAVFGDKGSCKQQ